MKKISVKQLPAAILKWVDNFDDFWFHRYVRSLGYTVKEVVEISKKNDDVCRAMKFALDSIFEKIMFKIANRTFTPVAADIAFKVYTSHLQAVTREIIKIDLNLNKNKEYYDEEENDDEVDDDS